MVQTRRLIVPRTHCPTNPLVDSRRPRRDTGMQSAIIVLGIFDTKVYQVRHLLDCVDGYGIGV